MNELQVETTAIDGLLILRLPVHGDSRGWFKENWQREKMVALGLPDFGPVQQNVSFNAEAGATRGIHAEPWDKLVSVAHGQVFGAWVDLRQGPGFGTVVTVEMGPDTAVFVPYGVGNSYQAQRDDTVYTYLVNDHWSPQARAQYTYVNLFDPALGIEWPIPRSQAHTSEADDNHPLLADVVAMKPRADQTRTVVLGGTGQLGTALLDLLPNAVGLGSEDLDITDAAAVAGYDWDGVGTIINAAAWTGVDTAETEEGRPGAWQVNATGAAHVAAVARERGMRLVQVSTDYVFDGSHADHAEQEPLSPLGVYGQSKAAGEVVAATVDQHWIVRTSWVIGTGDNFVRTMASLADRGIAPQVVDDQYGRLAFTEDVAAGIVHLLDSGAAPGIYHLTNGGPVQTWADIAARVFELRGKDRASVTPVSTREYGADKDLAPRPAHSDFNLDKIRSTGFDPVDADVRLQAYVAALQ